MAKLQKPPYVYMEGRLTPWDDAKIHVASEAAIRSISVFEGIKGYWNADNSGFNLLALKRHYDRLKRSAFIMRLPFEADFESFQESCAVLIRAILIPERDLWLRSTLFSVEGHWGENTRSDLIITSYLLDKVKPQPVDLAISTWQRPNDLSLPARVKSAANYQISRMARIEARDRGFHDMLLLNPAGRVAEASAAGVLMLRDGKIITPPAYEGCLESITVDLVEILCKKLAIPFERRPIERTEILVSDGVCLIGTLAEMVRVRKLENRIFPESSSELEAIEDLFWKVVREEQAVPGIALDRVTGLAPK